MPGMPGERRPGLKRDTGEGRLGLYFTNIGPAKGPISYRDASLRGPIGVLQARDHRGPIGVALPMQWDDQGRQLWRLTIGQAELAGSWLVIDREFVPAE